jgi:hypothetical protein
MIIANHTKFGIRGNIQTVRDPALIAEDLA